MSLGKPFQSMAYPGWFIPYEIKMVKVEKSLELRNGNPAKRYVMHIGPKQILDVQKLPDNEKYKR